MRQFSYWITTNLASLKKKTFDYRGKDVQGYLRRTNSECLHMEESVEDKEEMDFEV